MTPNTSMDTGTCPRTDANAGRAMAMENSTALRGPGSRHLPP